MAWAMSARCHEQFIGNMKFVSFAERVAMLTTNSYIWTQWKCCYKNIVEISFIGKAEH